MPLPALATLLLEQPEARADGPDLTNYLLVCAVLVASIALLGWGFRRLFAGRLRLRAARRSLRVVDMLPLGGRKNLAVVQCYDRTFLIGLGEKEVSLVSELEPVGEELQPKPAAKPGVKPAETFGEALKRAMAGRAPGTSRAAGILEALKRGEGVVG